MNILRNAPGAPLYLVAMVADVDGRKRAAFNLRRSEEQFRAAFESSTVGMDLLGGG